MRFTMRSLAAVTLVLLGGCAAATTESALPADHPANPNAAVAPTPPPSDTLALNPSTLPSPPAAGGAMNGMQHDMGGMQGMTGMQHDMSGMPGMQGHGGMNHASQPAQPETPAAPPGDGAAPANPSAASPASTAGTAAALYACPMHPEVTSTNPNDRCPKCNMKINKPVKAPTSAGATRAAPAPDHAGHDAHGGGH